MLLGTDVYPRSQNMHVPALDFLVPNQNMIQGVGSSWLMVCQDILYISYMRSELIHIIIQYNTLCANKCAHHDPSIHTIPLHSQTRHYIT